MTQTALGFWLQDMRDGRGLSLRELANLADVDHAYVYRLEAGDKASPSEEVLSKLIRALKMNRRDAAILRHIVEHTETPTELARLAREDPSIDESVFATVAGIVFRGNVRPDYPKLIERVRRILSEEDSSG